MTGKQLTTQNATITTATIQIQALTIGKKQVTLAVFRQLQEEPLLREDCSLNGDPWGIVNYHPDKCGDSPEHLHVVWQKGTELRRAAVLIPEAGYHHHPAADLYVQARIVHRTVHKPWEGPEGNDTLRLGKYVRPGTWQYFNVGRFFYAGMHFEGRVPKSMLRAWRDEESVGAEDRLTFEAGVTRLGISPSDPADLLAQQLRAELPVQKYQAAVVELSLLPQLFIAV